MIKKMKKNATTTIEKVEHEQQALPWLRVVCIHLCELTMNVSRLSILIKIECISEWIHHYNGDD